ncbi:hypothetical protein DERP_008186 [Dermatophagoides pteronyssinus]|uniref:Uncharacterized protein n=1 Tax=Dermatophagoides pteronyssinus TaxID=6956 RepID=A0ABQ8JKJ6_DERPT|nr:hypothetical protein DERP_008186 [Dermatophagoides pteronyssinus]
MKLYYLESKMGKFLIVNDDERVELTQFNLDHKASPLTTTKKKPYGAILMAPNVIECLIKSKSSIKCTPRFFLEE